MIFRETALHGAFEIDIEKHGDERGFNARTWCAKEFEDMGLGAKFVQANIAASTRRGTMRGLHYQEAPFAEAKLLRCVRGAIFDVIADVREDSPTYGQWLGTYLDPNDHRMIYVPEGCAHGTLSLEDDTEVLYQVSQFYTPASERGVRYDDPAFGIDWPIPVEVVSAKDKAWPDLARVPARPPR
jgi:dTDP-4-dehydrorhamnose 3,5-epimerase